MNSEGIRRRRLRDFCLSPNNRIVTKGHLKIIPLRRVRIYNNNTESRLFQNVAVQNLEDLLFF